MGAATKKVVLELPAEMVDLAEEAAARKGASVEEHLSALLSTELQRRESIKRRWEDLSEGYTEDLRRAGRLPRTADEVIEEARRIREEVARDSYP